MAYESIILLLSFSFGGGDETAVIAVGDTIEMRAPGYQLLALPSESKIIAQSPDYSCRPTKTGSFDGWTVISGMKFQSVKPGKYVFVIAHDKRNDIYSPYYWDFKRIFLEVK